MTYFKILLLSCLATTIFCLEADLDSNEEEIDVNELLKDLEEDLTERKVDKVKNSKKPVEPIYPYPNKPCGKHPCCVKGERLVTLYDGLTALNMGVDGMQGPKPSYRCDKRTVLKINFEKISKEPCDICQKNPSCGRRMLKIELDLAKGQRSGRLVHVADSISNDGYKGDRNHQQNDAEAEGLYPHIIVYSSDKCKEARLALFKSVFSPPANRVTIYVANNFIRVTNDVGFDEELCHQCLYALNGQSDSGPRNGINEDLYIGLNRVVTGRRDRNGVGVCSARLSWTCPWN